ncbi:hypothetical protein [Pseudofrankia sp. BMG5.37]|uniref:TolB family protein n=1 Tax=Pseudofrankia sp. BMG5.37 TaxID=3050035 RepID=UPI0028947D01|nr:hypothetical protein [Pseudofrankia sp. BMG5.37]MDT3441523.1 hypothetical protein [Pseudofrankia sp. BMG5.37]
MSPARSFVTLNRGGSDQDKAFEEVAVRDSLSGEVTATVPPPANDSWWGVSAAAADPRTFFLLATDSAWKAHVFRLTVDTDGAVASLIPIDTVRDRGISVFAVSPDGGRIAFQREAASSTGTPTGAGVDVIDVGDGSVTTFTTDRGIVNSFSWSADGRSLAFQLNVVGAATSLDQAGLWILDTTRAGGDLLAGSRQVNLDHQQDDERYQTPLLSADGDRFYVPTSRPDHGGVEKRLLEFDVATGRQLRVLWEGHHEYSALDGSGDGSTLALDPSGTMLMLNDAGLDVYRIDLATGNAARIPLSRGHPAILAW